MKTDMLHLESQLCFALYSANRAMTALYRPLLSDLQLTYPQYLVMMVLWETGQSDREGVSVSGIGDRLFLDSGTLTPLLKRLEKQGLIERRRASGDERIVHVRLTSEGQSLKSKAEQVPQNLLCKVGGDWPHLKQIRDQLFELNRKMRQPEN